MNEHEDLIGRLRALGSEPVSPELSERHLAAMEAAPGAAGPGIRGRRFRIVAAFAVGLFAGTSGLATAGALPDGAQEVAHRTLGAVGVKVPHGDRYKGPECGGAENHGQYVRSQPKDKRAEAAASRCGKPVQAGTGDDSAGGQGGQSGECQGPPPWAGKGKPDAAAKAARKQACGKGDDAEENEETPSPAGAQPAAPLTPETPPPSGPLSSGSETTATTATTGTTGSPTTATTGAPGGDGTTATTQGRGTTSSTAGSEETPVPSTPVEPPAVGQGS